MLGVSYGHVQVYRKGCSLTATLLIPHNKYIVQLKIFLFKMPLYSLWCYWKNGPIFNKMFHRCRRCIVIISCQFNWRCRIAWRHHAIKMTPTHIAIVLRLKALNFTACYSFVWNHFQYVEKDQKIILEWLHIKNLLHKVENCRKSLSSITLGQWPHGWCLCLQIEWSRFKP